MRGVFVIRSHCYIIDLRGYPELDIISQDGVWTMVVLMKRLRAPHGCWLCVRRAGLGPLAAGPDVCLPVLDYLNPNTPIPIPNIPLPLCVSCVPLYWLCAYIMLLRCFFPVPTLYPYWGHSLGVAFFSSSLLMSCRIFLTPYLFVCTL